MKGRHPSRELAFKALFEVQLRGSEALQDLPEILQRQLDDEESREFCNDLVHGCLEKEEALVSMIQQHTTHWDPKRLATTDRILLMIGLFEMAFYKQPPAVVIDEAVELAKNYGSSESPKFINGVLDSWNQNNEAQSHG